jgi:hypothetical protein
MTRPRYYLAAASRAGCLAVAVLHGTEVIEVRRRRLDDYRGDTRKVNRLVLEVARDYESALLVVEPHASLFRSAGTRRIIPRVRVLDLEQARRLLLGDAAAPSNRALFDQVVREHPQLRRFVTVLAGTGRVAVSERRRTVVLIAVALALAAQHLAAPGRRGLASDRQPLNSLT